MTPVQGELRVDGVTKRFGGTLAVVNASTRACIFCCAVCGVLPGVIKGSCTSASRPRTSWPRRQLGSSSSRRSPRSCRNSIRDLMECYLIQRFL